MSDDQERAGFEALTQAGADADAARGLGARLKASPQPADLKALAALWLHGAVAAPESLAGVYDAAAEGYLGEPVGAMPVPADTTQPPGPIPAAFWPGLWELLDEPPSGLKAVNLTTKTAALAGLIAPDMQARVGKAALAYPGVPAAVAQGYPKTFTLAALARCPADSLGGQFHALIVDNGFDLEVLDREALGVDKMPPPLDYLNARILQCHDLWHIVGGYQTTALHEVAISAFQLAQFGHHYSSMFLGMVLTRIAFERPEGGAIILPTILSAWTHGRRTPPLLGVDWESVWDRPLADVRRTLGVTPYASPFPADLFEQLSVAA
jgi:ubiquinone biosynthesis protein Coq4